MDKSIMRFKNWFYIIILIIFLIFAGYKIYKMEPHNPTQLGFWPPDMVPEGPHPMPEPDGPVMA